LLSKPSIENQVRYRLIIFSVFLFSLTVISCKKGNPLCSGEGASANIIDQTFDIIDQNTDSIANSSAVQPCSDDDLTSSTGLFVTVGDNGVILTSSDGISWTKRTSGTTKNLYGVTYGNSTFVTVGDNGTILTSSDGTTWTNKRTSSGTTKNLYGVTYGNSTFVTVGDNGVIITSSDGISWTKRTSGDQPTTTTIVSVSDSGGNIQIESTNHSLDEGDVIRFTTTDTLPTGLALATDYYVVGTPATNTFFVSATESGTPIVYTDGGTGTHSWQSAIALNRIIEQYDGRARASFSVTSVTTNSLSAVTYSNH